MYKRLTFVTALVTISCSLSAQNKETPLTTFSLKNVRLLESPFKQAQETDFKYILELNPDRLLAPYLRECGLTPKAESYGNWETSGLDGHTGGHYLSALANMYAATGNPKIKQRLDYMIAELKRCQDNTKNGYVAGIPGGKKMWEDVKNGKIDASSFGINGKWVPLYNIHKTFSGLYDAYAVGGSSEAKNILLKLTDWFLDITGKLSDDQAQLMMRSEHGGINEVFANVYALTGNKKYLELARKFSHRALLDPLLQQKDKLTGLHANTQIPKVIGFERIAQLSADTAWDNAANFFWHNVVDHRSVAFGGNSVREHFNAVNNFMPMVESREGPETCNSYNMLKLSKALFLNHPSSEYLDYYERTVYNHILASQRPEGGFVYFTPIRPGHYRVYSQPQDAFWCCVGSGLENHGKYGELIYAHNNTDVFVNLFIPSVLNWPQKGLTLTQQTNFPNAETSSISLKLKKASKFSMFFRHPQWLKNTNMQIAVNGKPQILKPAANGYTSINRVWKTGDVITLKLPMQTHAEFLPDSSNWVAFMRGPILLAANMGANDLLGLTADDSRMGHVAAGKLLPLDDAPLIVANNKNVGSSLTALNAPLRFSASKLIYQDKYKNLELVPFYTLHNTRYIMYWPYTSTQDLPKLKAEIEAREKAKQQLDASTVDMVNAGEQQPEIDHNIKFENTETGAIDERHFRTGKGWFSYQLNNAAKNAVKLRVTYAGRERNKSFRIYLNGELLTDVNSSGTGDAFLNADYEIPAKLAASSSIEVKFEAAANSSIARIIEVRLMK